MAGDMLAETAARLFAAYATPQALVAAEGGAWPEAGWAAVEESGFPLALVPEDRGGFGLTAVEALMLVRIAGEHALPLPLPETMLANWVRARAGLPPATGPLTVAADATLALERTGAGWRLTGTAARVPWGGNAGIVAIAGCEGATFAVAVSAGAAPSVPGANIAREPRDTLTFAVELPAGAAAPVDLDAGAMRAAGAVLRCLQIAGALARVTAMTVTYAQDRVQFGRPIGKFQAVQQSLAVLAAQTAAAGAAADLAAEALADGLRLPAIAAAKARCGEAAGIAAGITHQIHGAMGFTYEHSLHFLTKRLWSWRDEFGGEAEWSALLGRHLAGGGADRLWATLTAV